MKKTFSFLTILLLFSGYAFAQTKAEKEVAKAVEMLKEAMISGNKTQLLAITTKELSYGHSNGTIEDQATFVNIITSGKNKYHSIELTNQTITISGKTAIVRHNLLAQTGTVETPGTLRVGVLAVWQKQKNQWKLLARQGFKI